MLQSATTVTAKQPVSPLIRFHLGRKKKSTSIASWISVTLKTKTARVQRLHESVEKHTKKMMSNSALDRCLLQFDFITGNMNKLDQILIYSNETHHQDFL